MRMRHAVALTLVGVLAAACDTRDDTAAEPGLLPGDDTAVEQRDMVVARGEFQPTQQAEGLNISGWAEMRQRGTAADDGYELRVHVMGLGEGDHAWHIHSGTCESPGPIVLALSDAPGHHTGTTQPGTTQPGTAQPGTTQPGTTTGQRDFARDGIASDLNAGDDGMVEESVNLDREHVNAVQAHGANLIVNVHQRGGDDPGPAIACAPIQMTGAGTWGAQPGMQQQPGAAPGTTQPGAGTDAGTGTGARTY